MKRRVENWPIARLIKERDSIAFPEYQRQPNLWSDDRKALLIDSILKDIDIPKLYFNRTQDGTYEVVDGQQRLWALWWFIDNQYPLRDSGAPLFFKDLTAKQRAFILDFELQITVMQEADDDYLRDLFIRLQLGLLLIAGEKLNAATGQMKQFVFTRMAGTDFIKHLGIQSRRFAHETLCAQIAVNSFTRERTRAFARTRYEDLAAFFRDFESPTGKDLEFYRSQTRGILETLGDMSAVFPQSKAKELRNRSYALSLYLLFEERRRDHSFTSSQRKRFAEFSIELWKRLKNEIRAGLGRKNKDLFELEGLISSAPGEAYQIRRRHEKLSELLDYYLEHEKVKGDK